MMSMQKAIQLCHDRRDVYGSCRRNSRDLVHSILSPCGKLPEIRIGHGSGTLVCGVETEKGQSIPFIKETYGYRTAVY